jgi:hypothetical protein
MNGYPGFCLDGWLTRIDSHTILKPLFGRLRGIITPKSKAKIILLSSFSIPIFNRGYYTQQKSPCIILRAIKNGTQWTYPYPWASLGESESVQVFFGDGHGKVCCLVYNIGSLLRRTASSHDSLSVEYHVYRNISI